MNTSIITIPFDPERQYFNDETLKKFLLNKKVKRLEPEFFQTGGRPYWTVFVEYEPIFADEGPKHNLPQLSEPQRILFDKLRTWRREKADQQGIPVFIIATNSELAEVARKSPKTMSALKEIKGFGKKKVERHGKEITEMVQAFYAKPAVKKQEPEKKPA